WPSPHRRTLVGSYGPRKFWEPLQWASGSAVAIPATAAFSDRRPSRRCSRGEGHAAVIHPREFLLLVTERTDGGFVTQKATRGGRRSPGRRLRPTYLAPPILSPCHHLPPLSAGRS